MSERRGVPMHSLFVAQRGAQGTRGRGFDALVAAVESW
jgi:hypothetical protein